MILYRAHGLIIICLSQFKGKKVFENPDLLIINIPTALGKTDTLIPVLLIMWGSGIT